MSSKSQSTYAVRAESHPHPLARRLLHIAASKQTNIVFSADVVKTRDLLKLADAFGPHIAVIKTHLDAIMDFTPATFVALQSISEKHNFLIFEDRRFADTPQTVRRQYSGGVVDIAEWAHLVSASMSAGEGTIQALAETIGAENFEFKGDRGVLLLAEMTGFSEATSTEYSRHTIDAGRRSKEAIVGFVASDGIGALETDSMTDADEDFLIFSPELDQEMLERVSVQQVARRVDFVVVGGMMYEGRESRGGLQIIRRLREVFWKFYLERTGSS